MSTSREVGSAVVEAARRGDQRAQDELVAAYLPLVYNIVGRALNRHADAEDVVQDTMVRALHGLGSLRRADSFRSWLVAITMNQINSYWSNRRVLPTTSGLQDAYDVADPGADFVDLTIVRLGLQGQRREVAEASRWLDDGDRRLLSLWWMEASGELGRAEVASALELTPQHTAVRVRRMKDQLEKARIVVRALSAVPRCVLLDDALAAWDGTPSALWRKRISRHARTCATCAGFATGLVPAEGLLAGLGLVPVAGWLAELAGFESGGVPVETLRNESGAMGDASATTGAVPGSRRAPRHRRMRQQRRTAVAAALLITGGTVAGIAALWPDAPDTVRAASVTESPSPSAPAAPRSPTPSPTKSDSPSPSPSSKKPTPELFVVEPHPAPSTQQPTEPQPDPANALAEKTLEITNAERAEAGCGPLALDDRLSRASQLHSQDMSSNGYFDHTSQDGRRFWDRAAEQGATASAENIARGQNSAESVMQAWMDSEGHRNNILNCSHTIMGIGVVEEDWTWTQMFG
ncbi:sigma-70 family RNA polymerase sigma factor [Myceligenerans salitolerans]|uniref:RNA polymerase sigma factor n=1 Tax=Myceligenerans salitolerans TaxID=1230528 RepID=A0ABS3ICP9_9MICO|nr:sigma-70 family RNA polymerase sigma factor [Myceligenerans salitolerans]MBO0610718.1 sigma-70 family RNA polymerase sigma factor [Myceligenerans salitolerans]